MTSKAEKREWCYVSTAMKEFKLTRNQIISGIRNGLLEAKKAKNPHYSSGTPSTLVRREEIAEHLVELQAFSKMSADETLRAEKYRERGKLRRHLQFFCPRCKRDIRALRGSRLFESCYAGDVELEDARRALMVAHYRHTHTEYDMVLGDRSRERHEKYRELREEGLDYDEAWMEVDSTDKLDIDVPRVKYNAEAIRLLREDFPGTFKQEISESCSQRESPSDP